MPPKTTDLRVRQRGGERKTLPRQSMAGRRIVAFVRPNNFRPAGGDSRPSLHSGRPAGSRRGRTRRGIDKCWRVGRRIGSSYRACELVRLSTVRR